MTPLLYPIALLQFSSIQHSFLPKTGSVPGHVKLLGLDAPIKTELPPNVPPETEKQRARARAALRQWTKFCIDPKDFQNTDLS